jgi:hypothetical protein
MEIYPFNVKNFQRLRWYDRPSSVRQVHVAKSVPYRDSLLPIQNRKVLAIYRRFTSRSPKWKGTQPLRLCLRFARPRTSAWSAMSWVIVILSAVHHWCDLGSQRCAAKFWMDVRWSRPSPSAAMQAFQHCFRSVRNICFSQDVRYISIGNCAPGYQIGARRDCSSWNRRPWYSKVAHQQRMGSIWLKLGHDVRLRLMKQYRRRSRLHGRRGISCVTRSQMGARTSVRAWLQDRHQSTRQEIRIYICVGCWFWGM